MNENLAKALTKQRSTILKNWQEAVLASYQTCKAAFMRQQADRFANPVGYTIASGLSNLFDQLIEGREIREAYPALDNIMRIRAVQDLSPSQSVCFVFELKGLIRQELAQEVFGEDRLASDMQLLDYRIDDLALTAFDIYMKCREDIFNLKIKELQQRTTWILQRVDTPLSWQDAEDKK